MKAAELRDLETAQHEAAHVVVGAALGLRLSRAAIGAWPGTRKSPARKDVMGYCEFFEVRGDLTGQAIMIAAGIAWDRGFRFPKISYAIDRRECMKIVHGQRSVEACVTAAAAILSGRMSAHTKVTRTLLERDITASDLLELHE